MTTARIVCVDIGDGDYRLSYRLSEVGFENAASQKLHDKIDELRETVDLTEYSDGDVVGTVELD